MAVTEKEPAITRSRRAGQDGDRASTMMEDLRLSRLGFGAAPLSNEYGDVDETETERAVDAAIDCRGTFFDTGPYYRRTVSEWRLGAALRFWLSHRLLDCVADIEVGPRPYGISPTVRTAACEADNVRRSVRR